MGLKRIKEEEAPPARPSSCCIKANDESDGGYESRCKNKASLSLAASLAAPLPLVSV